MTDHTPTPYALYPGRSRHYVDAPADGYEHAMQDCYYVAGPDGPSHFVADVIVSSGMEGAKNVAFFRTACNCHDALVEACTSIRQWVADVNAGWPEDDVGKAHLARIDAALALAAKAPEGGA